MSFFVFNKINLVIFIFLVFAGYCFAGFDQIVVKDLVESGGAWRKKGVGFLLSGSSIVVDEKTKVQFPKVDGILSVALDLFMEVKCMEDDNNQDVYFKKVDDYVVQPLSTLSVPSVKAMVYHSVSQRGNFVFVEQSGLAMQGFVITHELGFVPANNVSVVGDVISIYRPLGVVVKSQGDYIYFLCDSSLFDAKAVFDLINSLADYSQSYAEFTVNIGKDDNYIPLRELARKYQVFYRKEQGFCFVEKSGLSEEYLKQERRKGYRALMEAYPDYKGGNVSDEPYGSLQLEPDSNDERESIRRFREVGASNLPQDMDYEELFERSVEPVTDYLKDEGEETDTASALSTDIRDNDEFDTYNMLLDQAFSQAPSEETLKLIDQCFMNIEKLSWLSSKQVDKKKELEEKILAHFSSYMKDKLDRLYEQLIVCFEGAGGSHDVFDEFVNSVKTLTSGFSEPMGMLLNDICVAIIRTEYSENRVSRLRDKLQSGVRAVSQEGATEGEIEECLKAAGIINRRVSLRKVPPAVSKNYLDRLTSLLEKGVAFSQNDREHCINALNLVERLLGFAQDQGLEIEIDKHWEKLLMSAIIDSRLPPLCEELGGSIAENAIMDWQNEEFMGFLIQLQQSPLFDQRFSYEFKNNLIRLSESDDLQACGDFLVRFKEMAKREIKGELNYSSLRGDDWYFTTLVEFAQGPRLISFYNARNSIRILAGVSRNIRREMIMRFFGNKPKRMETVLDRISKHKPSSISIKQRADDNKVLISLFGQDGGPLHGLNVPAITDQGIPIDSIAVEMQLLFDVNKTKQFYTNRYTKQLTLRYYQPPLMVKGRNRNQQPLPEPDKSNTSTQRQNPEPYKSNASTQQQESSSLSVFGRLWKTIRKK